MAKDKKAILGSISSNDFALMPEAIPISARQLEALVRLSEASARIRLSDLVEKKDAERAIRLLKESLEGVVTDPETGKIDIDIITTGQTHAKVERIRAISSIIREKSKEKGEVVMDAVIEEAKTQGIEEFRAKEIIRELLREGDIYEPRDGILRLSKK